MWSHYSTNIFLLKTKEMKNIFISMVGKNISVKLFSRMYSHSSLKVNLKNCRFNFYRLYAKTIGCSNLRTNHGFGDVTGGKGVNYRYNTHGISCSVTYTQRRYFRFCMPLQEFESQTKKWETGTVPSMTNDTTNFQDLEDKLYDYLSDRNGRLTISRFKQALISTGLRESDPRLLECMSAFNLHKSHEYKEEWGHDYIDKTTFKKCVSKNIVLIAKAFRSQLIIPDFPMFTSHIDDMYTKARENIDGNVATYIPQLARYSPNYWGVSLCTVDGQRHSIGDVNVPFCLQSVSKPLMYAMVLDELSPDVVHQYVGHEPSGRSFNTISLDYKDKPHNPMINAGAIVTCSLYKQQISSADRFDQASTIMKRLTGGEYWAFNNAVFLSERETADRNFALAYYMREKKCFPEGINLTDVLDFYFQMCSVEVTCESGSVIAATLANGGICPITGDKVFSARAVRDTLSLMHSCGMYDYSGQFAFTVGIPAKSGVAGGILLVVPNKMGFFMWSPPLDIWGNSVRGVQFCKELISKFNFHHYDQFKFTYQKIDPCKQKEESRAADIVGLLFSSYNNDVSALKRKALSGTDMDQADYDGRTALHIGAAEGHESVVKFLIHKCKCNPYLKDRWGFTAVDDAKKFNRPKIVDILQNYMSTFDNSAQIDRRLEAIDSITYEEIAFKQYEPSQSQKKPKGQSQGQIKGQGHKVEEEIYDVDEYQRQLGEERDSKNDENKS